MDQTPNYQLEKPAPNEYADVLLLNSNFDKIDEAIKEVSDAAEEKAPLQHTHNWSDIEVKPSAFPPTAHNHTISQITGLQEALNGKAQQSDLEDLEDDFTQHLAHDIQHGIFTMGGKRYQGHWLPNSDLTGLKFVYNEVTS